MKHNDAATWGILLAFLDVGFLTILGVVLIIVLSWSERSSVSRGVGKASDRPFPPAMTLLRRALTRRCPVCGEGRMFKSYFGMNERCASCGATFWKNEGEWMGPMVMDYTAAGGAALLTWLATSWFDLSELMQFLLPVAATIIAGVIAIPWSRSLWTVFLYLTDEMGSRAGSGKTPIHPKAGQD
ncbi:MAG TPA: DUF983 domain-containing protein [Candidatus Binataceae bacterium]|nr:DUF983 domain-containing protein [Candidatus Binataceae bacterium]